TDRVLDLLRLDPEFVRLHEAVAGLRRAAGDAPHVVRAWSALARRVGRVDVSAVSAERGIDEEELADASALVEGVRRLRDELERARAELRRGVRDGTLPREAADAERSRLGALAGEIDALEAAAVGAAEAADVAHAAAAPAGLAPMVRSDIVQARAVERA